MGFCINTLFKYYIKLRGYVFVYKIVQKHQSSKIVNPLQLIFLHFCNIIFANNHLMVQKFNMAFEKNRSLIILKLFV